MTGVTRLRHRKVKIMPSPCKLDRDEFLPLIESELPKLVQNNLMSGVFGHCHAFNPIFHSYRSLTQMSECLLNRLLGMVRS
jgi:hypothetical protein